MAVSKRLRYEVLRRDNHACRYCGATAPDVALTVDHVVATTLGGSDDPSNLVAACSDCNSGKSATPAGAPLIADVEQDALRWAAAMHRATETAVARREQVMAITREVYDILDFASLYLPVNADDSIDQFLRSGLAGEEITDAAYTALAAKHITAWSVWRYFCGICWKKVGRRQDEARAILDAETPSEPPPPDWRSSADARFGAEQHLLLASVCDAARETI